MTMFNIDEERELTVERLVDYLNQTDRIISLAAEEEEPDDDEKELYAEIKKLREVLGRFLAKH